MQQNNISVENFIRWTGQRHSLASKTMKMGTSFIIRLVLATLINIPISLRLSNAQGVGGYTNPYSGAQPWSTEPIPQYIGA
jgi:hypothetical protein